MLNRRILEEYFKDFNPIYIAGDLDEVTITTYPKYAGEVNQIYNINGNNYLHCDIYDDTLDEEREEGLEYVKFNLERI
jgi:hypothetical protein